MHRKSQIGMEYVVILGFVITVLMIILGLAFFYSGTVKDRIKVTQVANFANNIISTAESVYYYGEPSKATLSLYLPEGVKEITISENNLIISTQTSSGLEKRAFPSNVPIEGSITTSKGIKKIIIQAQQNKCTINSV